MPTCAYCGASVKTERGLRQHIDSKPECLKQAKAKLGIVDLCIPVRKKPPPVASIPKRAYEDIDSSPDFDISGGNGGPYLSKPKRRRRFFGDEGRDFASKDKDLRSKVARLLGKLDENGFENVLRKYATLDGLLADDTPVMMDDDDDQELPATLDTPSDEEELSVVGYPNEDELSVAGGENEDELSVAGGRNEEVVGGNPDAEDEVPLPEVNPPGVQRPDYNHDQTINLQPNTKMLADFRNYCLERQHLDNNFSTSQVRAVKLLGVLKGTRAALNTYDAILDWHHREKGDITERETLQHVNNVDHYHSRKAMLANLSTRYFLDKKKPRTETVKLPNSKAKVTLTYHNAWDCIESLLTDPRFTDEDYNFHGNDPLAPPPPLTPESEISELHTGAAYRAAYEKFIKYPGKQVPLPLIGYIDGAVTGQFSDLPITAMKIALGIHRRKTREKEMAWRTLGYVAQVSTHASRGKAMMHESGHSEAEHLYVSDGEGEEDTTNDTCKAQDFHTMLSVLLSSLVDVLKNGFIWDLRYRGKTYKDIEFVPFVMFIKADTQEADLLCGSYTSRGLSVAQLCRYCTCPTMESDLVYANYPVKTVPMIHDLVAARNFDGLQKLSQQMIQNAWYQIRFHPYNKQGIHGACPSEMLHAILLGVFKYTRDCFFEQMGPKSQLAQAINGLAQLYGHQFQRQSERQMPRCTFNQGLDKGKLMAKEYRGILLVIAAILRSQQGQDLLSTNENFASPQVYKDWVLLVEMLLEWEAFLNEDVMTVHHIRRLRRKNRFIMYLIKKVLNRQTGNGLKLIKFHIIIHMFMDILLYGVPSEVDTGSNESQHKLAKIAAKLTQKNETTFDFQTCTRLDEFFLIDLAIAELDDDLRLWDYFSRPADPLPEDPPPHPPPKTGGVTINVFKDNDNSRHPCYSLGTGLDSRKAFPLEWNSHVVSFLYNLQVKLCVNRLKIRGQHKREGMIFHGHPNFRERPWRDWATFNWGNHELPGQIWCFVIIDKLPTILDGAGNVKTIKHGGIDVQKGTYAVIESANFDPRVSEKNKSDLFIPIRKDIIRQVRQGQVVWRRKFYLADVESITSPLIVVPNVGARFGLEYLLMKPIPEWVVIFKQWLDDPHESDDIPLTEPIPVHNCLYC